MGLRELILIAVGLAMDAFAVSVCKGLLMKKFLPLRALLIALLFGAFQAAMPLVGWLLGRQFAQYITELDHWIAFALLAFIGGKMIFDSFKKDDAPDNGGFGIKELLLLALATSIDALAVGITFAFLNVDVLFSVAVIGGVTLVLCFIGVVIGHAFGARFKDIAVITGGIILVLTGIKILLEHLGIFSF